MLSVQSISASVKVSPMGDPGSSWRIVRSKWDFESVRTRGRMAKVMNAATGFLLVPEDCYNILIVQFEPM